MSYTAANDAGLREKNAAAYVAVVGGANVDIFGRSDQRLQTGDSSPGSIRLSAGGVARNVAENLARLDIETRLISAVGKDLYGDMLLDLTARSGVDTSHVLRLDTAPTSGYLAILDETGELVLAVNDMSLIDRLTPRYLDRCQAMLSQAALVIADANLTGDTLGWLAKNASGKPLFADAVSASKAPRLRPVLGRLHTLKASTLELESLLDGSIRSASELQEASEELHAAGLDRLFVTRGPEGVFYSTGDKRGMTSRGQRPNSPKNSGGAGDAFLAGLAYAWLHDWPLEKTLTFALAAADITLAADSASSPALSVPAIEAVIRRER